MGREERTENVVNILDVLVQNPNLDRDAIFQLLNKQADRRGYESEERVLAALTSVNIVQQVRPTERNSFKDQIGVDFEVLLVSGIQIPVQVKSNDAKIERFTRRLTPQQQFREKRVYLNGQTEEVTIQQSFALQLLQINKIAYDISGQYFLTPEESNALLQLTTPRAAV